jgi:hypothetical protein
MVQLSKQRSTQIPRTRLKRAGRLTGRLVSEEGMSNALRYLLEDTQHYLFLINRSSVNPATGEDQDASITLSEKDPPSLGSSLDPRIRHSRRIIVVLVQNDGGVAKIDLTARKWEIWIKSATLRGKLSTFNKKLLVEAHSPLITTGGALSIAAFPIWAPILMWLVWSFSSRKARYEVYTVKNSSLPWPAWIQQFENVSAKFWPILILAALGIWIIVLSGGGLRIWPSYLSRHSLQRATYEIRSNFALPQNLNSPLFVGIAGAVVGAILVYILTHYPG